MVLDLFFGEGDDDEPAAGVGCGRQRCSLFADTQLLHGKGGEHFFLLRPVSEEDVCWVRDGYRAAIASTHGTPSSFWASPLGACVLKWVFQPRWWPRLLATTTRRPFRSLPTFWPCCLTLLVLVAGTGAPHGGGCTGRKGEPCCLSPCVSCTQNSWTHDEPWRGAQRMETSMEGGVEGGMLPKC